MTVRSFKIYVGPRRKMFSPQNLCATKFIGLALLFGSHTVK